MWERKNQGMAMYQRKTKNQEEPRTKQESTREGPINGHLPKKYQRKTKERPMEEEGGREEECCESIRYLQRLRKWKREEEEERKTDNELPAG